MLPWNTHPHLKTTAGGRALARSLPCWKDGWPVATVGWPAGWLASWLAGRLVGKQAGCRVTMFNAGQPNLTFPGLSNPPHPLLLSLSSNRPLSALPSQWCWRERSDQLYKRAYSRESKQATSVPKRAKTKDIECDLSTRKCQPQ